MVEDSKRRRWVVIPAERGRYPSFTPGGIVLIGQNAGLSRQRLRVRVPLSPLGDSSLEALHSNLESTLGALPGSHRQHRTRTWGCSSNLAERLFCTQEAVGSSPTCSTRVFKAVRFPAKTISLQQRRSTWRWTPGSQPGGSGFDSRTLHWSGSSRPGDGGTRVWQRLALTHIRHRKDQQPSGRGLGVAPSNCVVGRPTDGSQVLIRSNRCPGLEVDQSSSHPAT